ncbi:MAG: hypothetical protein R3C03_18920 [Pirellulaceae bacterium]
MVAFEGGHFVYLRTGWQFSRWTYQDYRRPDVIDFMNQARDQLRKKIVEHH